MTKAGCSYTFKTNNKFVRNRQDKETSARVLITGETEQSLNKLCLDSLLGPVFSTPGRKDASLPPAGPEGYLSRGKSLPAGCSSSTSCFSSNVYLK